MNTDEKTKGPGDYVPDNVQATLIQLGQRTTDTYFQVGDIANMLYLGHQRTGKPYTTSVIFWAVGVYYGKAADTIRRYAEIAALFDEQDRTRFVALSFSHFATARSLGSKMIEALEYAADNAGITAAKMRKKFISEVNGFYSEPHIANGGQHIIYSEGGKIKSVTQVPEKNIPWLNILNRMRMDIDRIDVLLRDDKIPIKIRQSMAAAADDMIDALKRTADYLTRKVKI